MPEYKLGRHRGKFVAVWYDGNGERRRRSLGTTDRGTALRLIAELDAFDQRSALSQGMSVADLYKMYETSKVDTAPHARIVDVWKALGPHFGHLTPDLLDERHCKAYAAARQAQGRSVGTVHTELGYLRTALTWAHKRRKITHAPFVWMPPKPRPRDRRLTRAEGNELIKAARQSHMRLFLIMALHTAARAGAILDLTWDRIDFARNRIYFDNPDRDRTSKGRATIPMTKRLRRELEAHKPGALSPYVIEWGGNRVGSVKKGVAAAARRAGIADVSPHVLRHTAASWMAERGVPMTKIATYLGHTDSRTTERVYAKFAPEYLQDAADALDLDDESEEGDDA